MDKVTSAVKTEPSFFEEHLEEEGKGLGEDPFFESMAASAGASEDAAAENSGSGSAAPPAVLKASIVKAEMTRLAHEVHGLDQNLGQWDYTKEVVRKEAEMLSRALKKTEIFGEHLAKNKYSIFKMLKDIEEELEEKPMTQPDADLD